MIPRLAWLAGILCSATAFAEIETNSITFERIGDTHVELDWEIDAVETTSITFTRAEVAQMALLWETDTIAVSSLANGQYPIYTTNWQYIFPHTNITSDGDVHTDMAVDSSGTGSGGNNTGASPIVSEIINA